MHSKLVYFLLALWSVILFVDVPRVDAIHYPVYNVLEIGAPRLIVELLHGQLFVSEAETDGFDFWQRAREKLEGAQREAADWLKKAEESAVEMGARIKELKDNMEELVQGASVLHEVLTPVTIAGEDSDKLKRFALNNDLEFAFDAILEELQAMVPPLNEAPEHEQREMAVSAALDKIGDALVGICRKHGLDEERVRTQWQSILRPAIFTSVVLLGDIAEQHPDIVYGLLFALAVTMLPEAWLFRPLLRVFGFGPQGPIKGSAAAWAQRVFYGAEVPKGSWFATLQRAGMVAMSWWSWVWCFVFNKC
ncbi:hypothetical protein C8F01DRAFT_1247151 [Mycena amicta]|nr:hypothetical protein C8F01DRAFT_1247151 [Mycena amicta]